MTKIRKMRYSYETYSIQTDAFGNRWILCLICRSGSYNLNDIEQKYCAHCHVFHEDGGVVRAGE